jgi:hypothetical protein
MVHQVEKYFKEISSKIGRWREILAVPYQRYLRSRGYDLLPSVSYTELLA